MAKLNYLFYLSKYYEFLDTWTLSIQKKPERFIQIFHHIGAVLIMGMGVMTRNDPHWIFVVFNSLVHTVMYFYYFLAALRVDVRAIKKWITRLQILQFVSGILLCCFYYRIPGFCSDRNGPALISTVLLQLYVLAVLALFLQFYAESYRRRPAKPKQV
eukprot:CAMPEP_0196661718 /NCGR_PEP_ID=MMETSP1086-20130531/45613_1 /TAXON_ID=77921 /ORGANISM="Cyanoptyche  gloeocystis , Strain SAG4.97" /LENGTH=157 /DNA_ID=CAMNT_0041996741 /DNA_START=246 /DNA_END=719 /DNA_ORIENTATION=-